MCTLTLDKVFDSIVAEQKGPVVVGIGGGECVGKSFIATELIQNILKSRQWDGIVLPIDGYLSLSRQERHAYDENNLDLSVRATHIGDHPDCFDLDQLQKDIRTLLTKRILKNPRRHDYDDGKVVRDLPDIVILKEKTVIIVEGLFALHGKIINSLQSKIFLCATAVVSRKRYLKRHEEDDEETRRKKYDGTVIPSYHKYIEPTAMYADYIGHNNSGIITFHKRRFNVQKLTEEHTPDNRSDHSTKSFYRVFLAHNISKIDKWIENDAKRIAKRERIELVMSEPGGSAQNPAADVCERLEEVEGLVAIITKDSDWVSNEISMAYALHLPIYVIVDYNVSIDGIVSLVTESVKVQTNNPDDVSAACKKMFSIMKKKIKEQPCKGVLYGSA